MKKKFEASKVIVAYVLILTTLVTITTLYITIKSFDLSALAYLIPAIFAELATATGFYYKKAEAENKIKLAKTLNEAEKEIDKKIFIDDVNISEKTECDAFKEA